MSKKQQIRALKLQKEQTHSLVLTLVRLNDELVEERDYLLEQLDKLVWKGGSMATRKKTTVKKATKKSTTKRTVR